MSAVVVMPSKAALSVGDRWRSAIAVTLALLEMRRHAPFFLARLQDARTSKWAQAAGLAWSSKTLTELEMQGHAGHHICDHCLPVLEPLL